MLEIRQNCENCNKDLPNDSNEAMICTYECTFCKDCVTNVLENVCPNCGGGFEKRPTRPHKQLDKFPMRADRVFKPIAHNEFLEANKNIDPRKR
ncbi:DUF1272 domain-containing protein [Flavobacterium sp.]|uniref:DUF1272 domain-containing protein n=1 Tax=Flavobacterium sp. TaxID=239 RepID=UPI003D0A5393